MTASTKAGVVAGAVVLAFVVVAVVTATSGDSAAVSAIAAAVSALAAVTTASVSAGALIQVQADSRSATRPQVGVWMRRGGALGCIDLVVKNFGQSIAHDVHINIVGLPEWTAKDPVLSAVWKRYQQSIPTLVPDLELSNSYTYMEGYPKNPPDRVTVHVSYSDDARRPYSDTFVLDADLIRGETWAQPSKR